LDVTVNTRLGPVGVGTSRMIVGSDMLAAAARERARAVKDKQLQWARRRGASWWGRLPIP